ncbi:hypothetical protein BCR43DRAFT_494333 [Syncephalastrum racemosum]|uniref:Uncharacterized protein n=1 Tax=Syncephalastrum racemosum TaxID=13706 RepID=A0A1X2H7T2_SYNRA|nr:hypothetical protein BCR43DRAFT_494333 [Syncephalastrum racemosum]
MNSYVYHIPPLVRESSRKKPIRRRREPTPPFHPEIIDTFCFQWPALHSFVLVRVLDSSIALLPIRSRRAFLYFHHAPLPPTPEAYGKSSVDRHRRPSRIQAMFHSWKHTLVLPEEDDIEDTHTSRQYMKDDDNSNEYDKNTYLKQPRQRQQQHKENQQDRDDQQVNPLTLQDVLNSEPIHRGWIHAECSVTADPGNPEYGVILMSAKARLVLTARSSVEQRMFLNLVRLKHDDVLHPRRGLSQEKEDKGTDESDSTIITSQAILATCQQQLSLEWQSIQDLLDRLQRAKTTAAEYQTALVDLDNALDHLALRFRALVHHEGEDTAEHAEQRLLEAVQQEVLSTRTAYEDISNRMKKLNAWMVDNPDIVGTARLKLSVDRRLMARNYTRPWVYVLIICSFITGCCYYCFF